MSFSYHNIIFLTLLQHEPNPLYQLFKEKEKENQVKSEIEFIQKDTSQQLSKKKKKKKKIRNLAVHISE